MAKKIAFVCILSIFTTLLESCQFRIPKTQKHNYTVTSCTDYGFVGTPEFVDDIASCVDPEKRYVLLDGYLYEYQSVFVPDATNQLVIATDEEGSIYQGCGYLDNVRIRSVFEIEGCDYAFVTGFIPIKMGDIIYLENNLFNLQYQKAGSVNIAFYNVDRKVLAGVAMLWAEQSYFEIFETNEDGYISAIKVNEQKFSSQVSYIRLTLIGSSDGQIISINEPLDQGHEEFIWTKTEKYVSDSWYEEIKTTVNTVDQVNLLD